MRTASGRTLGWLILALCSALLFACGGGGGGSGSGGVAPDGSGVGRVAVLLTDAPTDDFDEVNVTVNEVYLLSDEGKVLVFSDPAGVTRNLLDLRDSAELMFDSVEVPAGCYDKIRLVVSEVELARYQRDDAGNIVEDGDGNPVYEDPFPVYPKLTGNRKIDLNPRGEFCVAEGETLVLQLDMDAKRSIHVVEKKHGTEYNFRPVVFVKVLDGDQEVLGKLVRLSGWVEDVAQDRFTLCGTNVAPLLPRMVDDPTCTEVVITRGTSLFDIDGSQVVLSAELLLPDALSPGDFVTAVGRYSVVAVDPRAADRGAMDDLDHRLRRFMAEVVEIGDNPQTWGRYAGEVTSVGSLQDCVGTFDVLLDAGQGVTGNLELPVHLVAGTRLFDPSGGDLTCTELGIGRRVTADAVLFLSDEPSQDMLKAAMVVIEPEMMEPETRIDGKLVSVEDDGRILGILPEGGTTRDEVVCAAVLPNVIPVLEILTTGDEGGIERMDVILTPAFEGLPVTVFGVWHEDRECFAAGAVVVTGPLPESGT